jgi:SAM-dependent methyltransferase
MPKFNKNKSAIKGTLRKLKYMFTNKYRAEMRFWRSRLKKDGGVFDNSHYQKLLLAMAEEETDEFLQDKVVADFGCGPRGSLVWVKSAKLRLGIDVLSDRYAEIFKDNIISHGMIHIKSTEKVIPLPSDFVDVLFTLNAMDHVDDFYLMSSEIVRIIKPGGLFIGSFYLEGEVTKAEPQKLCEKIIKSDLLSNFLIVSYRITAIKNQVNVYEPFFSGQLDYEDNEEGILWVKAIKKDHSKIAGKKLQIKVAWFNNQVMHIYEPPTTKKFIMADGQHELQGQKENEAKKTRRYEAAKLRFNKKFLRPCGSCGSWL